MNWPIKAMHFASGQGHPANLEPVEPVLAKWHPRRIWHLFQNPLLPSSGAFTWREIDSNSLYISNEARLVIVGTKRCTGIFAFLVFLGISASSIICSPTRCDFSRRMVSIPATNQQYQLVILRQSYVAVIHRIICWTAWLKKLLIKDLYILELM